MCCIENSDFPKFSLIQYRTYCHVFSKLFMPSTSHTKLYRICPIITMFGLVKVQKLCSSAQCLWSSFIYSCLNIKRPKYNNMCPNRLINFCHWAMRCLNDSLVKLVEEPMLKARRHRLDAHLESFPWAPASRWLTCAGCMTLLMQLKFDWNIFHIISGFRARSVKP